MKRTPDSLSVCSPQARQKPSFKIAILALAYSCFFMLMLWAAYSNRLPLQWLSANLPYYDKIGHLLLYCIPSYLGHCLCQQKHVRRLGVSIPVFPLLFSFFTVAEELVQGFSPHRTLDGLDMVFSVLGIAAGYWLAQRSCRRRSGSRRIKS